MSRIRVPTVMCPDGVDALLRRTLGYEIATVLMDSELRFSEIKAELSEEIPNIHDNEIWRILRKGMELNIIEIPPTRKGTKYSLNQDLFSSAELMEIRRRAKARITNEPIGGTTHADGPKNRSRFTHDFPICDVNDE